MEEQKLWNLRKPKGHDLNRCEIKPKIDDQDSVEGYVVEVHYYEPNVEPTNNQPT